MVYLIYRKGLDEFSSKSAGKDKKGNKLYWIKKEDLCNKYVDTLENRWYT